MATNKIEQTEFATSGGIGAPVVLDLVVGFNNDAQDVFYLQLFDADVLPGAGTPAVRSIVVGPLANFSYAPSQQGRTFRPGFIWAASLTPILFTPAPAARFLVTFEGRALP